MKEKMPNQGILQLEDFECALRGRYAEATTHLSTRTQAQLHNRLQAVIAQGSRMGARRPAWLLVTAFSLALVAVFGMKWRATHETMLPTTTLPTIPAPALVANGSNDSGELVATLDETPDLYLWLQSEDANALVTE
jgi:hypothetical protein